MRRIVVVFVICALLASCSSGGKKRRVTANAGQRGTTTTVKKPAPPAHVFIIELENESFDSIWGEDSVARYLNDSLVPMGKLLTNYYAVGHASLDNYIAQISGQPPNAATRGDCITYTEYANGTGCVYPASIPTIASQLDRAGKTWKSYQEDMSTPCRHPKIGAGDTTVVARKGDQYTTRHNPFVYFHSIIDSPECQTNVVDLKQFDDDVTTAATTPNLVFITPNLCHDGHDAPCVDGEPGGLTSADQFLSTTVPKILSSPAYKANGLLVIVFDEAAGSDTSACCGEKAGTGGGRTGALLVSRQIAAATIDDTPYNHYALLCSIEDRFGLPHLGQAAAPGLHCFGKDVYDTRS